MTYFLCPSLGGSAAYHVWPPRFGRVQSAAAVNLQKQRAPVFSSEAYMTNRTGRFKQLELSLAINHLDSCYCACNRAAFRREECRGGTSGAIQCFWSTHYCETNSLAGTYCCSMCASMVSIKIKVKQQGTVFPLNSSLGNMFPQTFCLKSKYFLSSFFSFFAVHKLANVASTPGWKWKALTDI